MTRVFTQIGRGFAMGAADIVPGVSGGTVALLLGIYEKLLGEIRQGVSSISRFVRFDFNGGSACLRKVDWVFLLSLLFGIGLAVVVLLSWLRTQIDEHPVQVSAVFFGLVVASIAVARTLVRHWGVLNLTVAAVVAVSAFVLLGQRSGEINDPSLIVIVGAGAVAICAMILPGISGSFILLTFGLYDHVTTAVDDRDLATIAAFGVGAVIGLSAFSTLLHWLIRKHHDVVLGALIGLMAGSLRVLWPWPTGEQGLGNTSLGSPVNGEFVGAAVGAVVAGAVVLAVTEVGSRRAHRR